MLVYQRVTWKIEISIESFPNRSRLVWLVADEHSNFPAHLPVPAARRKSTLTTSKGALDVSETLINWYQLAAWQYPIDEFHLSSITWLCIRPVICGQLNIAFFFATPFLTHPLFVRASAAMWSWSLTNHLMLGKHSSLVGWSRWLHSFSGFPLLNTAKEALLS